MGRLENELANRIGLTLGEREGPSAKHINRRALRALDPSVARNDKDATHRQRLLDRITGELERNEGKHPDPAVLAPPTEAAGTIDLDTHMAYAFADKMVRVLTHSTHGEYVMPPSVVESRLVLRGHHDKVLDMVHNKGVEVLEHVDDVRSFYWDSAFGFRAWALSIWDTLRMVAFAGDPDPIQAFLNRRAQQDLPPPE